MDTICINIQQCLSRCESEVSLCFSLQGNGWFCILLWLLSSSYSAGQGKTLSLCFLSNGLLSENSIMYNVQGDHIESCHTPLSGPSRLWSIRVSRLPPWPLWGGVALACSSTQSGCSHGRLCAVFHPSCQVRPNNKTPGRRLVSSCDSQPSSLSWAQARTRTCTHTMWIGHTLLH